MILIGIGIGLLNGFGIGVLNVPPIIMTLATGVMLNGAIVMVVGLIPPPNSPEFIEELIYGQILGVPNLLIILILTILIVTVLLSFTPFGRKLYAIGTSVTVSRFSGVQPLSVLLRTYALSSVAAVLAGMLLLGFTGTVNLGIGLPYLFPSVAATIVGGASILGGAGHFVGTVAGATLLIMLQALLTLLNLGAGAISMFYGAIILLSVWLASLRGQRSFI
jgi:ribose transport system permease protein